MPKFVGKPPANETERAVANSRYVASIYVARKKVWEGRAGSREEAEAMGREQSNKYKGRAKTTTVIRESE